MVEHRIGEERTDAAGVRVGRVDHHPLAPTEGQYRLPDPSRRRTVARSDAERGGQLAVPDRRVLPAEPEPDLQHDGGVRATQRATAIPELQVIGRYHPGGAGG